MKPVLIFLSLALFLSACQGSNSNEESSRKDDVQESLDELSKSIEDLTEGKGVKTIHHDQLRNLLPKRMSGFSRTDIEGNTSRMLGIGISTAKAVYEKRSEEVEISVVDAGSLGVIMSMADWADVEIDKSDRHGFERTATLDGYRCFEKFDKRGRSELAVIVGNRFLVAASGKIDDFDDLRDLVSSMKLKRLEKMTAVEID